MTGIKGRSSRVALAIGFLWTACASALADCNGNGIADAADIESGFSEDCNGNELPDECEFFPVALELGGGFPVARLPRVAVAADFDGDGITDLATGNQDSDFRSSSTVSVLLSRGDRTFESVPEFPAGQVLSCMTARDLDGDGRPDLVSANFDRLLVFRNRGGGVFETAVELDAQRDTRFVVASDLTGDGLPDLVTANTRAGTVSVFENRGGGTFAEPLSLNAGVYPVSVAPCDADGDGGIDLAVADRDSGAISVLLARGHLRFAEAVSYDAGGEDPFSVTAEDLDGDGDIDLAVASSTGVSVLPGDGAGTFGPPISYAASPISLATGDFDEDGDVDLAYASDRPDSVSVLVNDNAGTFHRVGFQVPDVRWAISAADLDGDADVDLVMSLANPDRIAVLWNEDDRSGASFYAGTTFPVGGDPHSVALGDLDGDGDVDLITGNNNEDISVLMNRGDGTFAAPRSYSTGGNSFSVALADLDGDGDLDLASADLRKHRVQVLLNSGTGDFETPRDIVVRGTPFHVTVADLDGDGSTDLITANQSTNTVSVLLNAGDGSFDHPRNIAVGIGPVATAPADFDGDGDIDLAVADQGSSEVSILENPGDGILAGPINYPVQGRPSFVAAGDLDLDGHTDLVTADESTRSLSVFWNTGLRRFESARSFPVSHDPYSLIILDLGGDDRPEIVTASQRRDSLSILANRGGRSFLPAVEYPVGSGPRFVLARDLDGDGAPDLVSANRASANVTVFLSRSIPPAGDYLETICTELDFHSVSVPSGETRSAERVTKYVLPARDDPMLLPTVFPNSNRYPLHEEFLREAFPERFGALTGKDYNDMVLRRETRDYYIGKVTRMRQDGGFVYAFTVITEFDRREVLKLDEIEWVYESLSAAFHLGPLCYRPDTALARQEVEENWPRRAPVPVCSGGGRPEFDYEAYSLGVSYGRLRVLTLDEFEETSQGGCLSFRDIPVVDQAPRDVEGVVAGLITGEPQGKLSHTAIRLARRGTPNGYVAGAPDALAQYDGVLVRLEVCKGGYSIDDRVTPEEAEEFWKSNRPELPEVAGIDEDYEALDNVLDMDLSAADGVPAEARFGGKASNFARMQRLLTGELEKYREPAFAIPMHYYVEFLRTNRTVIDGREVTYEGYLRELFSSPGFQEDSCRRSEALEEFRRLARQDGIIDQDLVARLAERIPEMFGRATRMVRFRSSSNTEDALEFNGAGLYESTSVCAADTLDPETRDASRCDPARDDERTVERALKKVWTSLWTPRAFEERAYYGIPQESAAMGILVSRAFLDESANGVAFTGNPQDSGDRRYVITVQRGEESVVSPEPGVTAERNLLEVVDGHVVNLVRERGSSLARPGETVLSDEQLRELASFMWHVDGTFPLKLEGHAREDVLLDFEFKIETDGSLAVKQVRPFLLPSAPKSPTFELEIPPGTTACGVFSKERTGRGPREELETKSTARFVAGTIELPAGSPEFSADLLEEVRFGPRRELAEPEGPGTFRAVTLSGDCNETTFRFNYRQSFVLPGGESLEIRIFGLDFKAQGERPLEKNVVLDEEFLTSGLSMQGSYMGEPVVSYSSCGYDLLPLWEVEARVDGGSFVRLEQRFLPSENDISTGPASLVRAEVELEGARQTVVDYWRLVYAAERHNRRVRYWVVLDPPLDVASVQSPVHAVEVRASEPTGGTDALVLYLGEPPGFEVLATPRAISYDARLAEPTEEKLRRGDVNVDGTVNLGDVLELLGVLFHQGESLACEKAADADDSGRLNVSDPVRILLYLFGGGGVLPEPFEDCDVDPTPDGLDCVSYPACEQ